MNWKKITNRVIMILISVSYICICLFISVMHGINIKYGEIELVDMRDIDWFFTCLIGYSNALFAVTFSVIYWVKNRLEKSHLVIAWIVNVLFYIVAALIVFMDGAEIKERLIVLSLYLEGFLLMLPYYLFLTACLIWQGRIKGTSARGN